MGNDHGATGAESGLTLNGFKVNQWARSVVSGILVLVNRWRKQVRMRWRIVMAMAITGRRRPMVSAGSGSVTMPVTRV